MNKPQNVTGLHEPDADTIRHLEELLELAKKGKLRSIIEVVEWSDGGIGSGFRISKHAQQTRMLGELHVLAVKMANKLA